MKQYEPCIQNNIYIYIREIKTKVKKEEGICLERERARRQGEIFIFIFSSLCFFLRSMKIGP